MWRAPRRWRPPSDASSSGAGGAPGGGAGQADARAQWQILLDDVNARGGVLGHKLVPLLYRLDQSRGDAQAQEQAACAQLVQDNHVFAAMLRRSHTATLLDCLEKAGVVTVMEPAYTSKDAVTFERHPHYLAAGALNLTRVSSVVVDGLVAQGFLTKTTKIGLVAWSDADHDRAIASALKPALARHGLRLTEEARTPPVHNLDDLAETDAQMDNVVLRFRSAGVDRVLFLGVSGAPDWRFVQHAEAQRYFPRYGLSTQNWPETLRGVVTEESFHGVVGVGWSPSTDVTGEQPLSARAERCKALMAAKGQPPNFMFCDSVDVFVAAAVAGGRPVTADSVMRGLESLGSLEPAVMASLRYGPGRHDGVAAARHLRYFEDCTCLRYTSQPYPI